MIYRSLLIIFLFTLLRCSGAVSGLTHHPKTGKNGPIPILWKLEKWNGKPVQYGRLSISLNEDRASVYGVCNSGSGKLELDKSVLRISELSRTSMACTDRAGLQTESIYWDALSEVSEYEWKENTLVLKGKNTVLEFRKKELEPDTAFESLWHLESMSYGRTVSTVPAGMNAFIQIQKNSFSGFGGCAKFSGTVQRGEKNSVSFKITYQDQTVCTSKYITGEENEFFENLQKITEFDIEGNRMILSENGREMYYFISRQK
ncbi:MAG TPA: META domain-containing protein [Leptospiraceae bacterium]|nr:META domain-containing protein [Leptospiraceae bacterium]HMZ61240.1 META domain-containing protein [Leptospiraceae bacterium]HNF12543.1 META domain-containing protein [Leptospiraceae bacterium]HNI99130.1 META domain-containing protein [Leptospiraceae bacterium]HNM05806.1 META domain-containing protein [Leptospiraceae bacterium]